MPFAVIGRPVVETYRIVKSVTVANFAAVVIAITVVLAHAAKIKSNLTRTD